MLLWASYWSHSIDLTCKMIWDLNLYIGGSTDYQWMHINLVILWRTCNFGHLGEKKNDCQNQPMCTTENSAPATWRSPRIYMGSSMKSGWRGSKEKCLLSMDHMPGLEIILLIFLTETLRISCMLMFQFRRWEDWGSVQPSYLVDGISRTVWFQACASCPGLLILPDRLVQCLPRVISYITSNNV